MNRTGFFAIVAVILVAARAAFALPASVPAEGVLSFKVLMAGQEIGAMTTRFTPDGDRVTVDTECDLNVKLAFITIYTYRLRTREVWRGELLGSLEADVDDDGKQTRVTARATESGIHVEGPAGPVDLPRDAFPSNYWNKGLTAAKFFINNQLGEAVALEIQQLADETLTIRNQPVPTQRYHLLGREMLKGVITPGKPPYIDLYLWYDNAQTLAGLAFTYKGFEFRYVRQ